MLWNNLFRLDTWSSDFHHMCIYDRSGTCHYVWGQSPLLPCGSLEWAQVVRLSTSCFYSMSQLSILFKFYYYNYVCECIVCVCVCVMESYVEVKGQFCRIHSPSSFTWVLDIARQVNWSHWPLFVVVAAAGVCGGVVLLFFLEMTSHYVTLIGLKLYIDQTTEIHLPFFAS